jgi:hypothetical protein
VRSSVELADEIPNVFLQLEIHSRYLVGLEVEPQIAFNLFENLGIFDITMFVGSRWSEWQMTECRQQQKDARRDDPKIRLSCATRKHPLLSAPWPSAPPQRSQVCFQSAFLRCSGKLASTIVIAARSVFR